MLRDACTPAVAITTQRRGDQGEGKWSQKKRQDHEPALSEKFGGAGYAKKKYYGAAAVSSANRVGKHIACVNSDDHLISGPSDEDGKLSLQMALKSFCQK